MSNCTVCGKNEAGDGGKDDADDWIAQVHTITAGIASSGVPAGAAEETHGKSDVGICVRRFRSSGRAAHSSETLSKDHEQAQTADKRAAFFGKQPLNA